MQLWPCWTATVHTTSFFTSPFLIPTSLDERSIYILSNNQTLRVWECLGWYHFWNEPGEHQELAYSPWSLHKPLYSPDVIKTFPNRFADLKGSRVVLWAVPWRKSDHQSNSKDRDGTLLTQRLHFAPMPHPYRHVLGWYRIIKELQDSEVTAFCIFDGAQRSLAKQLEVRRGRKLLTFIRVLNESNIQDREKASHTTAHRISRSVRGWPSSKTSEVERSLRFVENAGWLISY